VGFSDIVIPLICPHPQGHPICSGAPTTPSHSSPQNSLSPRPPFWHISTLIIQLLLKWVLLTIPLQQSFPRSLLTMVTYTRSPSTHTACNQLSSTTRSMTRSYLPSLRPSNNGTTTWKDLHTSYSCSPITKTSSTLQHQAANKSPSPLVGVPLWFNYLICYHTGWLGTKPDALTHHDV